jgi:hypothetical protein
MNDSKNSSNGLLVLTTDKSINQETEAKLRERITPLAETLGLSPMVLVDGLKLTMQVDHTPLLSRIADALEALVAQGQPPELSEPQIAPQALNARPEFNGRDGNGYQPIGGGLNARPPREL